MKKVEDHSCNDHIELSDECNFKGDYLLAEGECTVCERKLVLLFEYVNTRDAETDEIIE